MNNLTGISNWVLLSVCSYLIWGPMGLLLPASLLVLGALLTAAAQLHSN